MKYLLIWLLGVCCFSNVHAQRASLYFIGELPSRVSIGQNYFYTFKAYDSAQKKLAYAAVKVPAWLRYDSATQTLSGKAIKAGQYPVQLAVTNGGATAYQNCMLTVYDEQTTNILCLGNSITNGTNKFNSYRRSLWQMLHKENYNIDFIGSWNKHHMGGEVPDPDFDMDHDGHSGWTFPQILQAPDWDTARGDLHTWLQSYTPDMVLIELGTNDVFQCVPLAASMKAFTETIALLRNKNKSVKILVAQIPPLGAQWASKKLCGDSIAYEQKLAGYNKMIVRYAAQLNTQQSPVVIVDQFTGVDPSVDMYDDIHPNDKGEKIMAQRWFDACRMYLEKLK